MAHFADTVPRVSVFCLTFLLCACAAQVELQHPDTVRSDKFLPEVAALRSTSEVSGRELTDEDPVSYGNFNALLQFAPDGQSPLAFAVYEYDMTDFQPARITVQTLGCDCYVLIANFAELHWRLVASIDADASGPTPITSAAWEDPNNFFLRDTWADYYSPDGSLFIAVVSQQAGYLQSILVEDSRDFGLRALAAYQEAEDDYFNAQGKYFHWVFSGADDVEQYVDPTTYKVLTEESRNHLLGCWAYVVNATPTEYDLAVAFTRRDGECGYIFSNTSGVSAETQEPWNPIDLIAREACRTIAKQEAAYHAVNGSYGVLDDLTNPPDGQSPYLDSRYGEGSNIGLGIIVVMFWVYEDVYAVGCGNPGYTVWEVDESGEVFP